MKKLLFIIFLVLGISSTSYSQLSNFTLTVTKTDESCTGNGTLSFTVANTTAGSTIIYRIYKLPDLVNTIAVLSTNTFGGLTAGTYRVIATQTLGTASFPQQRDITILDTRTNLTYQVSSTAVDCNTGTINVNVLTGNPATYEILSGPVTAAPQASNSFPNLPAGTYNIRVNDVCGEGIVQTYTLTFSNPPNLTINTSAPDCELNTCNTISINYAITASGTTTIRYPLTVQISIFPPGGGTPTVQNLTIASGSPNNLPLSSIIPFYHGQLYTYNIRVVDACGNVYVRNSNQISLQLSVQGNPTYVNCLKGIRLDLCTFLPPYTVTFLTAPAGFNPAAYNGGHPGPFTSGSTNYVSTPTNTIPNGTYMIQVTDACNRAANCQVIVREFEPLYAIIQDPSTCDPFNFIQIPQDDSNGPFISSAVITASTANLGHPIPYDVTSLISGGVLLMPLPAGTYTIQGVDVCGRPYSYTFTMPPKSYSVATTPNNATGCSATALGSIKVQTFGALIASIVITQAPTNYNHILPYTVPLPAVPSDIFTVPGLPPGNYILVIRDTCNNVYTENVTVGSNISSAALSFFNQKGCGDTFGAIALVSPNGGLLTVIITAAPASFPFTLPYNVSFNIYPNNGFFYMNSFPEGSYTFYTKDACNLEKTTTYNIVGYHQTDNIQVIGNCGSFDLNMNFSDNTTGQGPVYWLQKFNPVTNQWVHPITGVVYPDNSVPNITNSYSLTNSVMNYNIAATGTFRILTRFSYYSNGSPAPSFCLKTIKTFDYNGDLKIISAYAIPCVNGGSQVFIIATGIAPLNYRITTKDGAPFLVNNGTSNSFAGLQPGTYNFRVQDACGNIVNRLFDITTLQQPEITPSNLCEGSNGQLSVQPFSFLNYEWWKDNNTTTILSTTNVLSFNPYTSANAGVYHVRIYSTTINSCVDRVLTYTLSPNALPNAGQDGSRALCGPLSSIDLFTILTGTYTPGGSWQEITSSGMLVGNHWLPDASLPLGTYTFKYTVNGFCSATDDATVSITLTAPPATPVINVNSPYCPGEDLEFSIQAIPNAVYQWSGPNSFVSSLQNPTVTGATIDNAGTYTIKAIIDQCESQSIVQVVDKPSPDYTYEDNCEDGVFQVEIVPNPGSLFDPATATYSWTGPNNFTSTSNPLILTAQPAGDYSVIVTNNQGCFSPQTFNIRSTLCDLPNVITPGTDGSNDNFDLTGYDVDLLQVFSRWGRLVYEENNYIKGWYGQNMHGGYLPDSTYYYFLRLKNGQEKHGWIFVGRGK